MPARNVTRCPAKSAFELDLLDELNCVDWMPLIPGTHFKTFARMRRVWECHGAEILPHYIRQRPGTRPFALYALGEIPMPPLKNEIQEHTRRVEIEGVVFYCRWNYFGSRTGPDGYFHGGSSWGEFHYLRGLGIVDDAEAALAEEWVDDRYHAGYVYRDYEALSNH